MVKMLNRAKMTISSTGTGNITLSAAVANFQTFAAAGASDGDVVRYAIEDGANWEIGTGVMSSSATVLARTVSQSSNSGNALNLTSDAVVFATLSAEDLTDNAAPAFVNTIPATLELTSGAVSTINAKALDDDGFPVSYSFDGHNGTNVYSSSSLPPQLSAVSINQTTGVFSLTASTSASNAGSHTFRVRASDGVRTAVKSTVASLSFLPLNGLTGMYDMKDSSSYSGSGSTWTNTSSGAGDDLTIDTSKVTYNSSGTGGIPSLSLDTGTTSPAIKNGSGTASHAGLTSTTSPYPNTAIMIFNRPSSVSQTNSIFFASQASLGGALAFDSNNNLALRTGSAQTGSWNHAAAQTTAKFYLNTVDQSSMTQQQLRDFFTNSNNQDKYNSIVVTDGHFYYGWASGNLNPALPQYALLGEVRALVFYDRVLTATEISGVHAHFASDYSSSDMVQ